MLSNFADFFRQTGRVRWLFGVLLLMCFSGESFAENNILSENNPVIARIGSEYLKLGDIENRQINTLRRQLYDTLNAELRREAVNILAKKYPEFSVSKKAEVSDQDVLKFYNENELRRHGPLKSLTPRIKEYLEHKALAERYDVLYEKALKQGLAVSYLREPDDFLVSVPVDSAYLRGSSKAKVMLLEFSDYQCPYCSKVQNILAELRKKYESKVIFGYRHLPLSFHNEADEAAMAVECARDQNKFDDYHELLFKNQSKQQVSHLKQYARQLKIENLKKFDSCLEKETYRKRVENDSKIAVKFGINGAPGFVVGIHDKKTNTVKGEIIAGSMPKRQFVKIIEKYLKKIRNGN